MLVYTLMYNIFNIEITSEMRKLFEVLKIYKNYFDFKNAKNFLEHKNKNNIIDLIFDVKSLYESLYIFFEIDLNISRNYLLKNLILNCIREFTSCASVSMFLISKKNDSLRFCIDYRKLNVLIIKNKCSLSLIDETLNCFINVTYFIKLDFKNAYHRSRIRKSDE